MLAASSARRPFVAVCSAQPSKHAVPRKAGDNIRRLVSAGKPALVLPAVFGGASAAIADELERAGEAAGQAGRQALSSSQVPQWSNVQVPSGLKAPTEVANLFSGSDGVNPLLLLGAVASIAIPVLLFQALNPGSKAKSTSPANVLKALSEDPRTVLVDIRSSQSAKSQGSPDLSSTKRRIITVPYTRVTKRGEPEAPVQGFGAKLAKLSAIKPDSIVILLDSDGKSAGKASAEVPAEEYDQLFYVGGGAAGWEASGQPWKAPGKGGFSLDLSGLSQGISRAAGTLKVKAGSASSAKGGAAGGTEVDPKTVLVAGGALLGGVLLFSQTGLFLEIVGLGAAANVVYKNFFYAEDRERSTKKLKQLVNEEVSLKDAGRDLQRLASVVLEGGEEVADAGSAKVESSVKGLKADARKAADSAASKVESAADSAAGKAESAADTAANGTGKAGGSLDAAAEEAAAKADEAKEDAKNWIDSWRSKQN